MSMSFLWIFTSLPVLVLQWVGVVVLARAGRRADWWCMLVGVVLATVSPVLVVASAVLASSGGLDRWVSRTYFGFMSLIGIIGTFGALLFMVGFCVHAFRAVRMVERTTELEAIASAQAEEMSRRGGQA